MTRHGLIVKGWTFAFNRRKRSLGICNYTAKRIELSCYFVAQNDEAAVRDTILHEIAHALAGQEAGHGPAWVAVCQSIGATPQRTCSVAVMPSGQYRARCKGCGKTHDRYRRPKRSQIYYCRACGPKRGRLRFVKHRAQQEQDRVETRIKKPRLCSFLGGPDGF